MLPFNNLKTYGTITEILGEGTYGKVYLSKTNKNRYAIKESLREKDGLTSVQLREIIILKNICHKNIIKIIDVAFSPLNLNIILELCSGNLSEIMINISKKVDLVKNFSYQLISAISYLTSMDVIHRDLSPKNILYTIENDGIQLKIADFGLAKTGKFSGLNFEPDIYTLWYRPPEILLGGKYDYNADVWALGCIIYEMYVGRALFPSDSPLEMIQNIFRKLGTPTEETWKNYKDMPLYSNKDIVYPKGTISPFVDNDKDLTDLIEKCITINPQNRTQASQLLNHPFVKEYSENITYIPYEKRLKSFEKYPLLLNSEIYILLRPNIIKSMIDFSDIYMLTKNCLTLAIYILDCYMIKKFQQIAHSDIIFISIMCLTISNKYEDIFDVQIFEVLSDVFPKEKASQMKILEMEEDICKTIDFNLWVSTSASFLCFYESFYSYTIKKIANAIHQSFLTTFLCFNFSASDIALSIIFLSCIIDNFPFKHKNLFNDIHHCIIQKFFDFETLDNDKKITRNITISNMKEIYLTEMNYSL